MSDSARAGTTMSKPFRVQRLRRYLQTLAPLIPWAASYIALNIWALISLAGGVALVGFLPQTGEIFSTLSGSFGDKGTARHNPTIEANLWILVWCIPLWCISLWWSMRIVSSAKFAVIAAGRPTSTRAKVVHAVQKHAPRLVALFSGTTVGAFVASFLYGDNRHLVVDAAAMCGFAVMARELVFSTLDPAVNTWLRHGRKKLATKLPDRPVQPPVDVQHNDYRLSALATALIALGLAWWSNEAPVSLPKPCSIWLAVALVPFGLYAFLSLRLLLPKKEQGQPPSARRTAWLRCFEGLLAILYIAFLILSLDERDLPWQVKTAPLAIGTVCALLFWFVSRRYRLWFIDRRRDPAAIASAVDGSATFAAMTIVLAMAGLVAVFVLYPHEAGRFVGTLGIGFLAISGWAALLTVVSVWLPKRCGLGTWAAIPMVWMLLFATAPDHRQRQSSKA